jgi:hypothetical protein
MVCEYIPCNYPQGECLGFCWDSFLGDKADDRIHHHGPACLHQHTVVAYPKGIEQMKSLSNQGEEHMSRGEFYGRLGVANLPSEVKKIWYSRDVEPEPCEPIDTFWSTTTDQDLPIAQDFARKIVEITPLTDREIDAVALCILDSCTLKEAGIEMNCTQERVRQILLKALRKFWYSRERM